MKINKYQVQRKTGLWQMKCYEKKNTRNFPEYLFYYINNIVDFQQVFLQNSLFNRSRFVQFAPMDTEFN